MSLRLSFTPWLEELIAEVRGPLVARPHSCQEAGNSVPAGEHGDVADPLTDSVTVLGA